MSKCTVCHAVPTQDNPLQKHHYVPQMVLREVNQHHRHKEFIIVLCAKCHHRCHHHFLWHLQALHGIDKLGKWAAFRYHMAKLWFPSNYPKQWKEFKTWFNTTIEGVKNDCEEEKE